MRRPLTVVVLLTVLSMLAVNVAAPSSWTPFHPISVSKSATKKKIIRPYEPHTGSFQVWIRYGAVKSEVFNDTSGGYYKVYGGAKVSVSVTNGSATTKLKWRGGATTSSGASLDGLSGSCKSNSSSCSFCRDKRFGPIINGEARAYVNPWAWSIIYNCETSSCTIAASLYEHASVAQGMCGGGGEGGGGRGHYTDARFYVVGDAGGADVFPFYVFRGVRWMGNGSSWRGEPRIRWYVGVSSASFNASDFDVLKKVVARRSSGRLEFYKSYGGDYRGGFPYRQVRLTVFGRGSGDIYLHFNRTAPIKPFLAHWERGVGGSWINVTWVNSTTMRIRVHVVGYYSWQAGWVKVWVDYAEPVSLRAYRVVVKRGNRTIVAGEPPVVAFTPNATDGGEPYSVYVYLTANLSPILPGALLLPVGLGPGAHSLKGGFTALLVNLSGRGLWSAQLPIKVIVPRNATWRDIRRGPSGYIFVNMSSVHTLPVAKDSGGWLLAVESPLSIGPVKLCVDSGCKLYNVTRLILPVEGVVYNRSGFVIKLRPVYECCPGTPVREHLVYVLRLGSAVFESPRDVPEIAVSLGAVARLEPSTPSIRLYARYSPGGPVPLQAEPPLTLYYGGVKPLAWDDSRGYIVFSRPYVWRVGKDFEPEPWNGGPGEVWLYVEEWKEWFRAAWNGTNFIVDIGRPTRNLRVRIVWVPPPLNHTDSVIIPLIQRW